MLEPLAAEDAEETYRFAQAVSKQHVQVEAGDHSAYEVAEVVAKFLA